MADAGWEVGEETYSDPEERRVLYAALDSFYQYTKAAHYNTTHVRRQSFYALPSKHWNLLASSPFNYLETLNAVDDGIDRNGELAMAILQSALQTFKLGSITVDMISNVQSDVRNWQGTASSNDLEKARSTLRQFYRDWSQEGQVERDACYGPVICDLRKERERSFNDRLRILVPGAGLGRLVFELCMEGFDVEGNEISYHQLLASSYILNNCPGVNSHTICPWIHSFSNHRSRANHLQAIKIPDVHPATKMSAHSDCGQMSMSASDFLCLYEKEEQKESFHAVCAVFFLDTAPNVIRYLEVIRHCLKGDGLLVNMGPLLWHFENNPPSMHDLGERLQEDHDGINSPGNVELTDDEIIALVEHMGFTIEAHESHLHAPYVQDPSSMLQSVYQASHWVARKR